MKRLIICGDSFNCGIGCENLYTQPYGVLLAKKLGYELITLARGGGSNYTTHLQVEYAVEKLNPSIIIIGTTSFDRFEWISEGKHLPGAPSAANINYHQYPPHNTPFNEHGPTDHFFSGKAEYNPMILTEQAGGIDYFVQHRNKEGMAAYFERYHNEPVKKLQLMVDYYVHACDERIKQQYDVAVLFKSYIKATRAGIRCVVLTNEPELMKLVGPARTHEMSWFELSRTYPDRVGSGHASPEAHAMVADQLYTKITGGAT